MSSKPRISRKRKGIISKENWIDRKEELFGRRGNKGRKVSKIL